MQHEPNSTITPLQRAFENSLQELSLFLNEHNRMPQREENLLLYRWVSTLIEDRKRNRLEPELIERLNAIGFFWNLQDSEWHKKARTIRLILLTEKRVVSRRQDGDILFAWFKESYARASKEKIAYGRHVFIESCKTAAAAIGSTLPYEEDTENTKAAKRWSQWFETLVLFREQRPTEWPYRKKQQVEQNKLAAWCTHLRTLYHRNQLTSSQLARLAKIGFPLQKKIIQVSWEDRFLEYKTFQEKHPGILPVPTSSLYGWARSQHLRFSTLTASQQALLNSLPIRYPFQYIDNNWNEKFARTKEYIAKNGRIPHTKKEKDLYGWIQWQRKLFFRNQLTEGRYQQLLQAGIVLQKESQLEQKWEKIYEAVKQFVKDNGHWPKNMAKGYERKLYVWMQAQRQAFMGTLRNRKPYPQEKINKLNDIGFRMSARIERDATWDKNIEDLQAIKTAKPEDKRFYINQKDHKKLYGWVQQQKTKAKNKKLSPERWKQLAELGFLPLLMPS